MKKKGFTLIELVMVIVIIGILAAVAIPRFVSLRDDAQQAACNGNIGAIRSAVSAFYAKSAVSGTTGNSFPASLNSLDDAGNRHGESFMVNSLPVCPRSGSTYVALGVYSPTTGVVSDHNH